MSTPSNFYKPGDGNPYIASLVKDPFALLGLDVTFHLDLTTLHQRYHQMQLCHHPDRPGGSHAVSTQMNWAYTQLRSPSMRLAWVLKHHALWPPHPSSICLETIFTWHTTGLSSTHILDHQTDVLKALTPALLTHDQQRLFDLYTYLTTLERLASQHEEKLPLLAPNL